MHTKPFVISDTTNAAIKLVLLDMDGTLLDLAFDNHFWLEAVPQLYARQYQLDPAEAQQLLSQCYATQAGMLSWYCLDYWQERLGLDLMGLKRQLTGNIRYRADALEFLKQLRQLGMATWLVTNAHPASVALKLQVTGLGYYLDEIICSHAFGVPKEHPDFWTTLVHLYHPDLQQCLFIDDSEAVLDTAVHAGVGQVRTILQPDESRPPRSELRYPALETFSQLFVRS